MNLLLVDDDLYILNTFAQRMDWKKAGIDQIYTAPGVKTAIRQLKEHPVDICICDIEMPQENGFALVQWIHDQHLAVSVILLTSHADFHYAKEAVSLRCSDYLVKPVSNEELLSSIRKIMAEKQLAQERTDDISSFAEESIVKEVQSYILENLQIEHTRRSIGMKVNMNPDYFARIFKRETGQTLNAWIQQKRIEKSKLLLHRSGLSLAQIADQVGFENLSYYSKVFKDTVGISPKEYRNKG